MTLCADGRSAHNIIGFSKRTLKGGALLNIEMYMKRSFNLGKQRNNA